MGGQSQAEAETASMNVVFLMQDTGAVYGQERATLDLIAGLRDAGHTPHVVLIGETRLGVAPSMLRQALCEMDQTHEVLTVRSRLSLRLVREIRGRLAKTRADVLHTLGYKANLHGALATDWGRTTPIVTTVHGWLRRPIWREQFYDWLDRRLLRKFRRVIVLSNYYESALIAAGVPPGRLARIPSGLDPQSLEASTPPETGFTVGIMGRLSFEKNHSMFLRAAATLCREGTPACYLIAGDGPDRPGIECQIRAMGLADSVIIPGYLSRKDFFGQVHVLILTSRIENLPYTVLEAMVWGRPVIATRVGGLPDLVEHESTGLLIEPDDHVALADAIRRLAQDPALRSLLAENARRKLDAEFNYAQMIARHIELYRELAEETAGCRNHTVPDRPLAPG